MRPNPVETVGPLQEAHDARQAFNTLLTGDEAAFHSDHESSDAKTAAASGHHVLVMLGIIPVEMDTLTRQARRGLCPIPHVVEVDAFDVIQQGIIIVERCRPHL